MANSFFPNKQSLLISLLLVAIIFLVFFLFLSNSSLFPNQLFVKRQQFYSMWEEKAYEKLIQQSTSYLLDRPLDYDATMLRGFAYFQLFFDLPAEERSEELLDLCIRDLRTIMLLENSAVDSHVVYVLAKAYYYKGSDYYFLSINYFEQAQAKGIDAIDSYEYLGLLYEETAQFEKQINILQKAIAKNPKDIYYIKLSEGYLANGQYDLARRTYTFIVNNSDDPSYVIEARLSLVEQLLAEDNFAEAERQLEAVFSIDDKSDRAYLLRGNLYQKTGEVERARYEWRQALKINSNNTEALRRLEEF